MAQKSVMNIEQTRFLFLFVRYFRLMWSQVRDIIALVAARESGGHEKNEDRDELFFAPNGHKYPEGTSRAKAAKPPGRAM